MTADDNPVARIVREHAEHCVKLFAPDFNLDFTVSSIATVERICEDVRSWRAKLSEDDLRNIVVDLGDYLLETLRLIHGGELYFVKDRNQPMLVGERETFRFAALTHDKVRGRIENGIEDSIIFYYEGLSERIAAAKPGDNFTYV